MAMRALRGAAIVWLALTSSAAAQTLDPSRVPGDALRDALEAPAEDERPAPLDAEPIERHDRPALEPPPALPPAPSPAASWLRGARAPATSPVVSPTTPWHGGAAYGRLLADGYTPTISFGLGLRRGVAVGAGFRTLDFAGLVPVFLEDTRRRYLEPRFTFFGEAVWYPRGAWFHLTTQLGPVQMRDANALRAESIGARAGALLGAEWHRPDASRQHWGLGIALGGGVSYVPVSGGTAVVFDGSVLTTATWY